MEVGCEALLERGEVVQYRKNGLALVWESEGEETEKHAPAGMV
jgi:hypothetical protein